MQTSSIVVLALLLAMAEPSAQGVTLTARTLSGFSVKLASGPVQTIPANTDVTAGVSLSVSNPLNVLAYARASYAGNAGPTQAQMTFSAAAGGARGFYADRGTSGRNDVEARLVATMGTRVT